ncbi:UNVERIFIED_CONTAM: hypothetical protein HDU68_002644 [Siphonaria sp. JEL0065]|nr:hypothetical protein HDU68_002644 [Siphonaria sp. JEL0065]
MSTIELLIYQGSSCSSGHTVIGVATNTAAMASQLTGMSCSSALGSKAGQCVNAGSFSEKMACGSSSDLLSQISGPVFSMVAYTDVACSNAEITMGITLNKCFSMTSGSVNLNFKYSLASNNTLVQSTYSDSSCTKEIPESQALGGLPSSSAVPTIPACQGQATPKIGVCTPIPASCVTAMASQFNGVAVGSFIYSVSDAGSAGSGTTPAGTESNGKSNAVRMAGASIFTALVASLLF